MKILLACEESQVVCEEFRKLGHEAYSCDILPTSGKHPEWHLQQDVLPLLELDWDMIIAFPPCTHLAVSGSKYFAEKIADGRQQSGIDFFMQFTDLPCKKVAIENPVGIMSSKYRKPDQIIQPYEFGEDASKKTCLWLKGLPLLKPTNIIPPKGFSLVKFADDCFICDCCGEPFCKECQIHYADCGCIGPTEDDCTYIKIKGLLFAKRGKGQKALWDNQTISGQNKLGPSADRAMLRSKTYLGIAKAMAEQWGN
jgi:hypothetical protein